MTDHIILLGIDRADPLRGLLKADPRIGKVTDCGVRLDRAAKLLNESPLTLFAVSTELPHAELARFTQLLSPCWRRGVLVGARDDRLGVWAINTGRYAAYLTPPLKKESVDQMLLQLAWWKRNWLAANGGVRRSMDI